MEKKDNNPEVPGLPQHAKDYSLAYFYYFATGEGVTKEAEILWREHQKPTIGFGDCCDIIPYAVEKEEFGQTFLAENPEFKELFLECFGTSMWGHFQNCCLKNESVIDLVVKMHYNLS
jgi:hypothetical protein